MTTPDSADLAWLDGRLQRLEEKGASFMSIKEIRSLIALKASTSAASTAAAPHPAPSEPVAQEDARNLALMRIKAFERGFDDGWKAAMAAPVAQPLTPLTEDQAVSAARQAGFRIITLEETDKLMRVVRLTERAHGIKADAATAAPAATEVKP